MAKEPTPTLTPHTNTSAPASTYTATDPSAVSGLKVKTAANARGGANLYGFASIETFCNQGALGLTHDDALGFYNYVKQFNPPNFWYQDGGVQPWLYYEQYDNWQDTYGADAVRTFYHSGHGGMDGNGIFYLPMGADWGGIGCTVTSNNMRLGNEYARYLFLSTCLSLRVGGGNSPIRTWWDANLGLRMIFGFETISYDNANYGRWFWEEWNKNKSLSSAWLDSSWRISHDQTPTAVACGATQAEAADRVFNERLLYGDRASKDWWWWRWQGAVSAAAAVTSVPADRHEAQLAPAHLSAQALFDRFEFGGPVESDGSARAGSGDRTLVRSPDGSFSANLKSPNLDNHNAPTAAAARSAADNLISRLALAGDTTLVLDRIIQQYAAGGTAKGSGEMADVRTTETIIQYRQTINGVPVISPDGGKLRVAVDNDGNVTRIDSALRGVTGLSAGTGRSAPRQPEPEGKVRLRHDQEPSPEPQAAYEAALMRVANAQLRRLVAAGGDGPVSVAAVPGTTEVGYAIQGSDARLIAARGIEVDFGNGYRKKYRIETPLGSD
jgi:Family of unknown function (DUF6345)